MPKDDIDFDLHGHCVKCHEDMSYEEVIDGVMTKRLGPDYQEIEYMLNDGSRMRVAICRGCKELLKDDDNEKKEIMDCVYKGWVHELKSYSHWSHEKKQNHLEVYSKKTIVSRTKGLGKDLLKKKLLKENKK